MKKTTDTSILENIAEDKISFELQKYDLLVAKPKSDRSGTDLLVFAEIADGVKFCRIQCKGRSLEYSARSFIDIRKDYVTDGFLFFLYIYFSYNSEELYVFLPTDIRQWRVKNDKYILELSRSNAVEKFKFYSFSPNKAELIKTLINLAETHGEFKSLIYGSANITTPLPQIRGVAINGAS